MPAECQFLLDQHVGSVHCVRMTHDGAYCMTAGEDRTIRLWNPHKVDPRAEASSANPLSSSSSDMQIPRSLCVQTYAGVHGYKVLDVAIANDKTKFASCGDDRSVYLWDVGTSRVLRRFQAHYQRTNAVMFNQDSTVLFTASYDKTVKCWDLRAQNNNRDPIETLEGSTDSVTALARTDNAILTASVDGAVRIYDLRKGCIQTDAISSDPITCLSVNGDGRMYLVSCLEASHNNNKRQQYNHHQHQPLAHGVVRLIDIESGKLFREYRGHQHQSLKVEAQFAADGRQIATGSEDGAILHWDLLQTHITDITHSVTPPLHLSTTGDKFRHQEEDKHAISSLAYHPNEELGMFVSTSYDGVAKVWKTRHQL
jgi:mitogen-activated protein kinase organizer 1